MARLTHGFEPRHRRRLGFIYLTWGAAVSSHSARFGLSLVVQGSATQTIEAMRRPADVGFDVALSR
jgi:hypothetical protein